MPLNRRWWLQIWILGLIVFSFFWHKAILRNYFILDYQDEIIVYSKNSGVSPDLISALIFVESRFEPQAESHKGALGLMQVMPTTGEWIAEKLDWSFFKKVDLLDPEKNLAAGTWYLGYLKQRFAGNEFLALASYNAGARYVKYWIDQEIWQGEAADVEQIPFPETRQYLIKIMWLRKVYRYLYPELFQ